MLSEIKEISLSLDAKHYALLTAVTVVEEHSVRLRRPTERTTGGIGRAYADMSSVKTSEKLVRRKSKVSWGRLIRPGLVGS